MLWLKKITNVTTIKKNTNEKAIESSKIDFRKSLKQSANLEIDNGSGYGIAKIHKLEDMI